MLKTREGAEIHIADTAAGMVRMRAVRLVQTGNTEGLMLGIEMELTPVEAASLARELNLLALKWGAEDLAGGGERKI
ncbi:MAG: hypothetical protein PHX05_10360 [Acidobacteriota bacterium]|nr:hypothetical protein [Acidobacteriota bacterium]